MATNGLQRKVLNYIGALNYIYCVSAYTLHEDIAKCRGLDVVKTSEIINQYLTEILLGRKWNYQEEKIIN